MRFLFKKIVESGIRETDSYQKKITTVLSNYVALALVGTSLIFLWIILQNKNLPGRNEALISTVLLLLPVFLNQLHLHNISRLYLCWVPPVLLTWFMASGIQETGLLSDYDGVRFYLLGTSCIPYLLLDRKNPPLFIAGVLPSFVSIIFCDQIVNLASAGTRTLDPVPDNYYFYAHLPTVVSYIMINASWLALKIIIERGDAFTQKLLRELAEKNKQIQKQATHEVNQLNEQLKLNLQQLSEREFILNQSQRIAKIGSWEYRVENAFLFWSDEMYNIFGLDKKFDLQTSNLSQILRADQSEILINATAELLRTGKPFDLTLEVQTPVGYNKWVRVQAAKIVSEEVKGVRGTCHDITTYKEAEDLLRESENKYRSLFEQASDAIVITDLRGNFIDANASFCNMFGYAKNELIQMNLSQLIDTEALADPDRLEKLATGAHIFNQRRMLHKDGRVIYVEENVKMFAENRVMAISRDVTDRKHIELEKERAHHLLNERIKELTTMYRSSQILNKEQRPINQVLQEIVMLLPAGWQYPEISAACITVNGEVYATPTYRKSQYVQRAEFNAANGTSGAIEVVYLEERPPETEGPFLAEERNLIDMVADMIRVYLVRKHEEEALSIAQANLRATINNTEILIWSVNRNFELLTYNKRFAAHVRNKYGIQVKTGSRILENSQAPEAKERMQIWLERYLKVLSGEILKLEENLYGEYFQYSLSPIIEDDYIIGVSVFAENVTDRKLHDADLAEANKKIGELKLMALRSVMSPHFIFNVLNSIQFFIAKNDRLNAITYLSTFSKLIRSVLTHSVNNKVKLADEIEMLKNYAQLEMTRFEIKFDFILQVDPQIDVDAVEIPSLLLQPYVENAILHGLYNKREKGRLLVNISEKDETIIFEIEDNGVGRVAAMELRKQNFPSHRSMGIQLTEERLKLINQHHQAAFEIEDLTNENGPCGTKVKIQLAI